MAPGTGRPAVAVRRATGADAEAVADLHADSWRRHYRGAYPDGFLDGPVFDDRRAAWSGRLSDHSASSVTFVAERPLEDGAAALVGFVHVVLDADDHYGALVDNLHVRAAHKGRGIGTVLLAHAARAVLEERPGSGLFLWVLEGNLDAQAFYRARGAVVGGTRVAVPPGGGAELVALRCSWPDPRSLVGAG